MGTGQAGVCWLEQAASSKLGVMGLTLTPCLACLIVDPV